MTENKRFKYRIRKETTQYEIYDNLKTGEYPFIEPFFYKHSAKKMCEFLNRQEERIQNLLRYKYLVKALEEVSGNHYIEEIISDYTDGAVSDEKEQLELGKWHSKHGLSWKDGDVE